MSHDTLELDGIPVERSVRRMCQKRVLHDVGFRSNCNGFIGDGVIAILRNFLADGELRLEAPDIVSFRAANDGVTGAGAGVAAVTPVKL